MEDLGLSDDVRVLAVAFDGKAELARPDLEIRKGAQVYLLCPRHRVDELRERFVDAD